MPDQSFTRFQVVCTVWACPSVGTVDVPGVGMQNAMQDAAVKALKANAWAIDRMGLLCPDHATTHKIGATK